MSRRVSSSSAKAIIGALLVFGLAMPRAGIAGAIPGLPDRDSDFLDSRTDPIGGGQVVEPESVGVTVTPMQENPPPSEPSNADNALNANISPADAAAMAEQSDSPPGVKEAAAAAQKCTIKKSSETFAKSAEKIAPVEKKVAADKALGNKTMPQAVAAHEQGVQKQKVAASQNTAAVKEGTQGVEKLGDVTIGDSQPDQKASSDSVAKLDSGSDLHGEAADSSAAAADKFKDGEGLFKKAEDSFSLCGAGANQGSQLATQGQQEVEKAGEQEQAECNASDASPQQKQQAIAASKKNVQEKKGQLGQKLMAFLGEIAECAKLMQLAQGGKGQEQQKKQQAKKQEEKAKDDQQALAAAGQGAATPGAYSGAIDAATDGMGAIAGVGGNTDGGGNLPGLPSVPTDTHFGNDNQALADNNGGGGATGAMSALAGRSPSGDLNSASFGPTGTKSAGGGLPESPAGALYGNNGSGSGFSLAGLDGPAAATPEVPGFGKDVRPQGTLALVDAKTGEQFNIWQRMQRRYKGDENDTTSQRWFNLARAEQIRQQATKKGAPTPKGAALLTYNTR